MANPFTYQGWMYESQTGYYYTGSNYYDPATGQSFGCTDKGQYDPGEDCGYPNDSGGEDENPACGGVCSSSGSGFLTEYAASANPIRLNRQELANARLIYRLARHAGLSKSRAREMVAAAYMESTLNTYARNPKSGAAGLFQLLSPGYIARANRLGGVYNPKANTLAILPDYVAYWKAHPNAAPGEAAAYVEASGMSAAWYASPLGSLPWGQIVH